MKINFSIQELIASDNHPSLVPRQLSVSVANNLLLLITQLLQPIRDAWGSGIHVNSGYRSPSLNKALDGVSSSAHLLGFAADIVPSNGKFNDFVKLIHKLASTGKIKFDQIILEQSSTSRWVHVGLYNRKMQQRGEIFCMTV